MSARERRIHEGGRKRDRETPETKQAGKYRRD